MHSKCAIITPKEIKKLKHIFTTIILKNKLARLVFYSKGFIHANYNQTIA